jgi:hypothetical protein
MKSSKMTKAEQVEFTSLATAYRIDGDVIVGRALMPDGGTMERKDSQDGRIKGNWHALRQSSITPESWMREQASQGFTIGRTPEDRARIDRVAKLILVGTALFFVVLAAVLFHFCGSNFK